jgi:hypothetical protein
MPVRSTSVCDILQEQELDLQATKLARQRRHNMSRGQQRHKRQWPAGASNLAPATVISFHMSDNLMVCRKSERYVKILMIIESSDSDVSKPDFPYFPTISVH